MGETDVSGAKEAEAVEADVKADVKADAKADVKADVKVNKAGDWTLRFEQDSTEDAYISQKDELFFFFSGIASLKVATGLVNGIAYLQAAASEDAFTSSLQIIAAHDACSTVLALALSALSILPQVRRALSPRAAERVCLSLFVYLATSSVVLDELFLDAVFFSESSPNSEARLVHGAGVAMGLNALVTITHLAMPIRWFLLVWADVCICAMYLVYSLRVMGPSADINIGFLRLNVLLLSVMAASAVGLRFMEDRSRSAMAVMVNERSMRAAAEFNVHVQQGTQEPGEGGGKRRKERKKRKDAKDEAEGSLPSTTATAEVLRKAAFDDPSWLVQVEELAAKDGWLIKKEELALSREVLGSGGCASIIRGTFCKSPVAIKAIRGRSLDEAIADRTALCNELEILRRLRHPNIVLFHGACFNGNTLTVVLEQINGKELDHIVDRLAAWKPNSPNAPSQAKILAKICLALIYLHSRTPSIVHGDLKPRNILVERNAESGFCPKLIDFGLARKVTTNSDTRGGTPVYMAPELMLNPGQRPRPDADTYSVGLLMYYTSTSRRPSMSLSADEVIAGTRSGTISVVVQHPTTLLFDKWRPMIDFCLDKTPSNRPSMQELHAFLASPKHLPDPQSYLSVGSSHTISSLNSTGSSICEVKSKISDRSVPSDRSADRSTSSSRSHSVTGRSHSGSAENFTSGGSTDNFSALKRRMPLRTVRPDARARPGGVQGGPFPPSSWSEQLQTTPQVQVGARSTASGLRLGAAPNAPDSSELASPPIGSPMEPRSASSEYLDDWAAFEAPLPENAAQHREEGRLNL